MTPEKFNEILEVSCMIGLFVFLWYVAFFIPAKEQIKEFKNHKISKKYEKWRK